MLDPVNDSYVTDYATHRPIVRRRLIVLDHQPYDAKSIATASQAGMRFVPHTRRPMTTQELMHAAHLTGIRAAAIMPLPMLLDSLRPGQSVHYDLRDGVIIILKLPSDYCSLYHTVGVEHLETLSRSMPLWLAVDTLQDIQAAYPDFNLAAGDTL